jgi:hypothetical protein
VRAFMTVATISHGAAGVEELLLGSRSEKGGVMTNPAPKVAAAIAVPAILGLIGLITLMGRPEFQAIRSVDALQLLASGMLLGLALAAVLARVRGGRG